MPRTKNATFQGVRPALVEPDATTFQRVIKNVAGDQALIFDKLTGENGHSASDTVNHTGSGRGARLGLPYINQGCPDARGYPLANLFPDGAAVVGSGAGALGETIVFAAPIYIPSGENDLTIEIFGEGLGVWPWRYEVCSSTSTTTPIIADDFTLRGENSGNQSLFAHKTDANLSGGLRILMIFADTSQQLTEFSAAGTRVWSLVVAPWRVGPDVQRPARSSSAVCSVTQPTTSPAQGTSFVSGFDAAYSLQNPYNAWLTANANRNANGLLEYVTGWPAHGNASYTHVDRDGAGAAIDINPTYSQFHAGTKSIYANEPEPPMNLWSECFGAILANGKWAVGNGTGTAAEPPLGGMLGWYAPWPVATTIKDIASCRVTHPDFRTTLGGPTKLKTAVLVGYNDASILASWTVYWSNGSSFAGTNPAAVTGTRPVALAVSASNASFLADQLQTVTIGTSRTGARGKVDEICILGACCYYDP